MSKFIITKEPQEQFDFKGKSLGMSTKSAVFYCPTISRQRYYRQEMENPQKGLKLLSFKTKKTAIDVCKLTNELFNDNYVVECIQ